MNSKSWEEKIDRERRIRKEILVWCTDNFDGESKLLDFYKKDFDIVSTKGKIKIQEDRLAHKTGFFAIKPSQVISSTADFLFLVDWEYVCFVKLPDLLSLIDTVEVKKVVQSKNGDKIYLIPREKILTNQKVTVLERWFSNL